MKTVKVEQDQIVYFWPKRSETKLFNNATEFITKYLYYLFHKIKHWLNYQYYYKNVFHH